MKWKISLFIAVILGALVGPWIKNLPGFMIIAIDKTTYEMRLWLPVCFLFILLLFVIYFILNSILSKAGKVKGWHGQRHWRGSRKKTIQGMLAFTEGRWKLAEDLMTKAAKRSDTQLINYLIAAEAAQHQDAEVRRDNYLRLAYQAEPAAKVAIGLTQAQLQLKHAQFEQALASLNDLRVDNPNHPYVLKLLCRLYEKLNDHQKLLELLPELKKFNVLENTELKIIENKCVKHILTEQANKNGLEALRDVWLNFPASLRKCRDNTIAYCQLLIEFEEMSEAENLLKPLIKNQSDANVLAMFGNVISSNPTKQLAFLESIQQSQTNQPREMFLTMGKVAYYAQLWGKARSYLEQALQQKPSAEAYLMMAKTLENLDQEHRADDCYKQGLEFVASTKKRNEMITLPKGSDDLIKADLLPKFQKLIE